MGFLMRSVRVIFSLSLLFFPNILNIKLLSNEFSIENQSSSIVMVPGSQNITLNQAVQLVSDGGVIEIASGVYREFIEIKNSTKNFVIKALNGNVYFEPPAGGNKGIFYLKNNSGLIIFEGLTVQNGYSGIDGYGGAVTVDNAKATFVNCAFINNRGEQPSAGGGAFFITNNSKVYIYSSSFVNNTNKNYGGAIAIVNGSRGWIVNSEFNGNRTNITGHRNIASGGAIHVGDAKIRVADSVFLSNESGFAGGAIYSIGRWDYPSTDVIVVNSKFELNKAKKATNVNTPSPNEGGAIHTEDNAKTSIYYSLFTNNQAEIGGAVSLYRAETEVYNSVFELNQSSLSYFGGSISATSNDTLVDGQVNRPSARLTIKDSIFKGDNQSYLAKDAGGIYVAGDKNRMYGDNNVSRMGTSVENRAFVVIENTAFLGLFSRDDSGHGGAVMLDLVNFRINHSLFFGNSSSNGGAISVIQNSDGEISSSKFIKNRSKFGGAIYSSGSVINVLNNTFSNNELFNLGANPNVSYGASLFMAVMDERSLDAIGEVGSNIFSENKGLPIYDRDNMDYPINRITYNNNQFFTNTFQDLSVYTNSNPNYCCNNVSKLNTITINRNYGVLSTRKGASNLSLSSPYIYGVIMQFPPIVRIDKSFIVPYVLYGSAGSRASLNGQTVGEWGFIYAPPQQNYTLIVGEQSYSVTIKTIGSPSIRFIKSSDPDRVEWSISNIQSSDLLDMGIDMVDNISIGLFGESSLTSLYKELEYRLFVITKYGGYVIENEKSALLNAPSNFLAIFDINDHNKVGFVPIYNDGGGVLNCQIFTNSQNISIETPELKFERIANIQFVVQEFLNRDFQTSISVSCGEGGYKDISLRVLIVDQLFKGFLPLINK
jgi:predicted outer membrane repeat protein